MPFHVVAYTIDALRDLLIRYSEASSDVVAQKLHSRYFEDYFAQTGVTTIIVEERYVDHDYLEDFAAYYVKCFHPYERTCTRLHFFRSSFDEAVFRAFLRGEGPLSAEQLRRDYAGFTVVRPLPQSIIGRTCLATYTNDGARRRFPTVFANPASLFGLDLSIDTVPFQEQDQITAACATSALWSAFQATGHMFQHYLPSPVEITRAATVRMPLRSRAFPNTDGLTIEQMAHAIREVGLEPYFVAAAEEDVLQAATYAYVSAGIPALLVFSLTGERAGTGTREVIGTHAATVTGYSIPARSVPTAFPAAYQATSARMDKLYVHDDQVGPYARMEFKHDAQSWYLSTSWGLGGAYNDVRAQPLALLLPLYNKIRIPFTRPLSQLLRFDQALAVLRNVVPILSSRVEWDLRLTTTNQLKREVLQSERTSGDVREQLLITPLPRFMWHATASNANGLVADILFDATDIHSGSYVRRIDIHDADLSAALDYIRANAQHRAIGRAVRDLFDKVDVAGP